VLFTKMPIQLTMAKTKCSLSPANFSCWMSLNV